MGWLFFGTIFSIFSMLAIDMMFCKRKEKYKNIEHELRNNNVDILTRFRSSLEEKTMWGGLALICNFIAIVGLFMSMVEFNAYHNGNYIFTNEDIFYTVLYIIYAIIISIYPFYVCYIDYYDLNNTHIYDKIKNKESTNSTVIPEAIQNTDRTDIVLYNGCRTVGNKKIS